MADATVGFLLNNFKELLLYAIKYATKPEIQTEDLEKDLQFFKAFLNDTVKKGQRNEEHIRSLVHNIRDVVYKIEDVIDTFNAEVIRAKRSSLYKFSPKSTTRLRKIFVEVNNVRKNVQESRKDYVIISGNDGDKDEEYKVRLPRKKDVVGFKDVTEDLKRRLTTNSKYLDVISVTGIFGQGKTTVAWKVYNDETIKREFTTRVWVCISKEFKGKEIFRAILKELKPNENVDRMDEEELSKKITDHLNGRKFLIVMDDVWSIEDWNKLKDLMPADGNKGKVLITSRDKDVGASASHPRPATNLRFFHLEESWELLQLEAHLRELISPDHDLYAAGQQIAINCKGIPLAIVIIGGILASKGATKADWESVSKGVLEHLKMDPEDRMNKYISLSYDILPSELRPCFLYLGIFPEDYEIPVSKLIRMWMGEGFIHHNNTYSLEETAETYLNNLINRNLVKVEKLRPNGKVKSCKIHDMLREFCKTEAGVENENVLVEIKSTSDGGFEPQVSKINECRRLSIHSDCFKFLSAERDAPNVRSFVCISKEKFTLGGGADSKAITAGFKLIKVLDVKPIHFTYIHDDIYKLVNLTFITLSYDMKILPKYFSKLCNIQTLIVETTSLALKVEADVWEMKKLRHFKTNAPATLLKPKGKEQGEVAEIQTLGVIAAESFTDDLVVRASNTKKLVISGRLALLLEEKIGSFKSLVKMINLEKLKLINDVAPQVAATSQSPLLVLPQPSQFPRKLKSLTLCATSFDWSYMKTLGLLENLEVLKLKNNAFKGDSWERVDQGFPCLEFLYIEQTNLKNWVASPQGFLCKLKGLVLRNCEKLVKIPIELADKESFQMLDLYMCQSAAASAREIQKKKKASGPTTFKLLIFPPDDQP